MTKVLEILGCVRRKNGWLSYFTVSAFFDAAIQSIQYSLAPFLAESGAKTHMITEAGANKNPHTTFTHSGTASRKNSGRVLSRQSRSFAMAARKNANIFKLKAKGKMAK